MGMGELHLDIKVDILRRTHGIDVEMGKPQVAYRESITQMVEDSYTHKKQTGGAGQFAKIDYRIEPGETNSGFTFESLVTGGNVPREYWGAIEKAFGQHLEGHPCRLPDARRQVHAAGRRVPRCGFIGDGLRGSHACRVSGSRFRKRLRSCSSRS